MYGSSVVFPLSRITDETYRFILTLNPMVPVIEGFRFAFLGEGTVTKVEYATSFGISAFIFLVGLVMFSRTEQTVMDTV
jgi:lipopolysaccharide transport system permease protein